MSKKPVGRMVGAAIMAAAIIGVFFFRNEPPEEEAPEMVRPLKTTVVGERVEALKGRYPGRVKAAQRVEMGFEVPGTLAEKLVRKGERVAEGQELARLDARDFQNELNAAAANLERAQAYRERMRRAAAKNAVSQQELDDAEAAFEIAQAQLNIKQKALEDTVLKASFDGIVADTYVSNFQNVQAKEPVLSLQDLSSLEIEVSVPEQRIAAATRGETQELRYEAVFDFFPDLTFPVELKEFSTEADPVTQTFAATFSLQLPEKEMVLPGMAATVLEYAASASPAAAIRLPLDLVPTASSGGYFVWRLRDQSDGTAVVERAPVEVGTLSGDEIEIVGGVETGERIAGAGVNLLREGQVVRPIKR